MARGAKKKSTTTTPAADDSHDLPPPLPPYYVKMIISGGQTGVDRAALEIAVELNIQHGGWCPQGRLAEDGPISEKYLLRETASAQYWVRTEKNVQEAEGTLILFRGKLTRGSALTRKYAQRHRRTYRCLQLKPGSEPQQISAIRSWLCDKRISTLNIAGPRESTSPGIGAEAKVFLRQLFVRPQHARPEPITTTKPKKSAAQAR